MTEEVYENITKWIDGGKRPLTISLWCDDANMWPLEYCVLVSTKTYHDYINYSPIQYESVTVSLP